MQGDQTTQDAFQHATRAIDAGDVDALAALLEQHPELAKARGDTDETLLIHLIDWPGHRPNAAASAKRLLDAGADVDARRNDQNGTSLAGALCTEETEVIRVLLQHGANIHAPLGWMEGAVLEFADHVCENAVHGDRPARKEIAACFSQACGRSVPLRPKMGSVTPLLFVSDIDKAIDFYCRQLGFRLDWEEADPTDERYLCISRGAAEFHMTLCNCPDSRHLGTLYARISVEDVDRFAAETRKAAVEFRREPKNQPWGLRECEIEDADLNRIIFWGPTTGDNEPSECEASQGEASQGEASPED